MNLGKVGVPHSHLLSMTSENMGILASAAPTYRGTMPFSKKCCLKHLNFNMNWSFLGQKNLTGQNYLRVKIGLINWCI
jgi:hypothetical protein